ncbi:MAG: hypothetical protein AB1728_07510, partial [Bacteroidota bacterium]
MINKPVNAVTACLLLISQFLYSQEISITDFRIPESKYQRLIGSLNGYFSQSSDTSTGQKTRFSRGNSVNSNFNFLYRSMNEDHNFSVDASLYGSMRNNSADLGWNNFYYESRGEGYYLDFATEYQTFVAPNDIF